MRQAVRGSWRRSLFPELEIKQADSLHDFKMDSTENCALYSEPPLPQLIKVGWDVE